MIAFASERGTDTATQPSHHAVACLLAAAPGRVQPQAPDAKAAAGDGMSEPDDHGV